MRRTGNTLVAKLPAIVVAALATCVWSAAATAQNPASHLPTAIISSGGSSVDSSSNTGPAGAADNSSAWTADRNPVGSQLRPNTNQAYPPLPGFDRGVVPASAQAAMPDNRVQPAVSPGVSSTPTSVNLDVDAAKHIPLAPPSDRFQGEAPEAASSTLQTAISVGSSLLLVVGLFLGVAWCYRRTISSSVGGGGLSKQVVQVMGRTSISTRQQMVLVRFGSKLLLVSVIQGEARTLSEISDPLEVDRMIGLCESGQPGSISNSFKSVLLQEGKR